MSLRDDINYEYKTPNEIINRFTLDMMNYFVYKFTEIFSDASISIPLSYQNLLCYEGTIGWQDAFDAMCREYELYDVAVYVDGLGLYDYDWFCIEFIDMLFENGLIVDE